jgi:hypothetical protein
MAPPSELGLVARKQLPEGAQQSEGLGQPGAIFGGGVGNLMQQAGVEEMVEVLVFSERRRGRAFLGVPVQLPVDRPQHVVLGEVAVDDPPGE